jgi:hypothetical protein
MLRFLIPRIVLRDLPPMFAAGLLGSIIAGCYGILHDQVTFSISPEYFTRLKFEQFRWANLGLSERVFVAEIGFLATWWVGLFCGWFLARRHIPGQAPGAAWRRIMAGCGVIVFCALVSAAVGFGYGLWRGPAADHSAWKEVCDALHIADCWSFVRVAYIHNASYLGGLIGLILALVCIRPIPTPAATSPA